MKIFSYVLFCLFFSTFAHSKILKTIKFNDEVIQISPRDNCIIIRYPKKISTSDEPIVLAKIQGNRKSSDEYMMSYKLHQVPMPILYYPFDFDNKYLNPHQFFRLLKSSYDDDNFTDTNTIQIKSKDITVSEDYFFKTLDGITFSTPRILFKSTYVLGHKETRILPNESATKKTSIQSVSWESNIIKYTEDNKVFVEYMSAVGVSGEQSVETQSSVDFKKNIIDLQIWNPSNIKICFKVKK